MRQFEDKNSLTSVLELTQAHALTQNKKQAAAHLNQHGEG